MPFAKLIDLLVEALIFLGISGVISILVALLFPRVRASRSNVWRVVVAGMAVGFLVSEMWAQLAHRERLGFGALAVCALAAFVGSLAGAVAGSRSDRVIEPE